MHKRATLLQVLLGPLAKHPEVPPACTDASGQHPWWWAEPAASTPRLGNHSQPSRWQGEAGKGIS